MHCVQEDTTGIVRAVDSLLLTLRRCLTPPACPSKVSWLVQVTLHTLQVQGGRVARYAVSAGSDVLATG